MSGGEDGDSSGRGGPLRRLLDRVDRGVDDELNRFFTPSERSRTGLAVDKYSKRVEDSIQRATKLAIKTKTDLDTLGDDTIDRLFGGGRKRPRSEEANIGWITKRPALVLLAVLIVVASVSWPALYITGNERLGIESYMRGDFEIFLPPTDETTVILNEVREHWSADAMFIYGEMAPNVNVTDVSILQVLSAIEGDDDHPVNFWPDEGDGYQEGADWAAFGLDPWRDDDGEFDGVTAVLSLPMLVKVVNETVAKVANQLGVQQVPGNYSVPDDQALVDRIIGQFPPDVLQSLAVDTDDPDETYDKFAMIFLLNSDPKIQVQVMDEARVLIERANAELEGKAELYLTGPTPLIQAIQDRTISEFFRVMPLVIIGLVFMLFLWHRTFSIVLIALVPVMLGLAMALGIVGLLHDVVAITPQVVIIAPVLLALGVSYGLYISNRFAEETEGDVHKRLARSVRAINPAIMLSALTTGIGFASLMIGTLPPIFTMGLALTIGILFTYVMTYILVPALIVLLRYKKKATSKGMKTFSTVPSRNRKKIVMVSLMAALISVALVPSVKLDADYLAMAPQDDPTAVKMTDYSTHMGGGQIGMFVVRSDPFLYYDTLDPMDRMGTDCNGLENTQAISVVEIMKSVAVPETIDVGGTPVTVPDQAQQSLWSAIVFFEEDLDDSPPAIERAGHQAADRLINVFYYSLPYEVRELLITTKDPSDRQAIMYCFMPFMDIDKTRKAVNGVNDIVAEYNEVFTGSKDREFASKLTGIAAITLAVNDLIIVSQYNSLAVSIFLTFLVLTIIFRSLKIGAMTVIPVITVIALEPGTLVGLGIPLSSITVMIGSIAIGTGVDFSIQISQRVRLGDYKLPAVFGAVERAGTSFVEATSTMLVGFAMTLFIPINSIQEFVIMIMILLTYNAVFALVLLPSIYTIVIRNKERKEERLRLRPPEESGGKWRDRYERTVKRLFRIRDEPYEAKEG